MATLAKQQYFGDESSIVKQNREFRIEDDLKTKLDGIEEGAQVNKIETVKVNGKELPITDKEVDLVIHNTIDNLSSTSRTDALSANMGRELSEEIMNLKSIGHFLSLWDCAAGMPTTQPPQGSYEYRTGCYYVITNVAESGGVNYRPEGERYIQGDRSTTVETESVHTRDVYFYDGTVWTLQINSGGGAIDVDDELSLTSKYPVQNKVITAKINEVTQSIPTLVSQLENDAGYITESEVPETANTKTFKLESLTDLETAQQIVDYVNAGKYPIVYYNDEGNIKQCFTYSTINRNDYIFLGKTDAGEVGTNKSSVGSKKLTIYTNGDGAYMCDISHSQTLRYFLATNVGYTEAFIPTKDYQPTTKKYVDDAIEDAVEQIEQEKTPNVTVVGTPTIVSGNISNFTNDNYLIAPFLSNFSNNPFILHMSVTLSGEDISTQQNIVDSTYGIALAVKSSNFIMALSTNGTSWNVGEFTATLPERIYRGDSYYLEIEWDGQFVYLRMSANGTSRAEIIKTPLTTPLSGKPLYFGGYGATPHPFLGTFNFNEWWFKSNGVVVWKGMDVAGLETRANVSLSNLDEEGEAKLSSYAKDSKITINAAITGEVGNFTLNQNSDKTITIPLASANKPGLIVGGNRLTVNQSTGKMEAGELTKAQYDSADGKIFIGKTTLNNVLNSKQYIPEGGTEGQVVTKTATGVDWSDLPESDMQYKDFNFTTPEGMYEITLGLSTTITPTVDFTLLAPTEVKDGQIYILRCDNTKSYVMTLGEGFTNPQGVDLTLTANAIDQFVFLAVGDVLELQGEGGSGSATIYLTQEEYDALPDSKLTDGKNYVIYGSGEGEDGPVTKQELAQALPEVVESVPTSYTPDKMYFIVKSNGGTNGHSPT